MAETETRPRRLPPETETLTIFLEIVRPRRYVGIYVSKPSRDRDVETETKTVLKVYCLTSSADTKYTFYQPSHFLTSHKLLLEVQNI